jgi:hypothetical protein
MVLVVDKPRGLRDLVNLPRERCEQGIVEPLLQPPSEFLFAEVRAPLTLSNLRRHRIGLHPSLPGMLRCSVLWR